MYHDNNCEHHDTQKWGFATGGKAFSPFFLKKYFGASPSELLTKYNSYIVYIMIWFRQYYRHRDFKPPFYCQNVQLGSNPKRGLRCLIIFFTHVFRSMTNPVICVGIIFIGPVYGYGTNVLTNVFGFYILLAKCLSF